MDVKRAPVLPADGSLHAISDKGGVCGVDGYSFSAVAHHYVDLESVAATFGGVHFDKTNRVLIRQGRRYLIHCGGARYWSGYVGNRYRAPHLCFVEDRVDGHRTRDSFVMGPDCTVYALLPKAMASRPAVAAVAFINTHFPQAVALIDARRTLVLKP